MRNISTWLAPLTECTKVNGAFKFDQATGKSFQMVKERFCSTPILALPNFLKTFKIECHASSFGIRAVLTQDKWSTA